VILRRNDALDYLNSPMMERLEAGETWEGGGADASTTDTGPILPEDLPMLWEEPDSLWDHLAPILAELDPPKPTGRARIDVGRALEAIIYRLRSGCQWNHLPSVLILERRCGICQQ
jgi:hypothetical protein